MRKIDYLVLFINIVLTILWIIFLPIRVTSWTHSIFIILAIPIVIIYWELLKKISSRK